MREEYLHDWLTALIKMRRRCQQDQPTPALDQEFLRMALLFVRDLMGEEIFQRAMKKGEPGEGVLLFANRVGLLEPLLNDNWPVDFTFCEMLTDLFAIANGDEPRILKSEGRQGKFRNAHRLVEEKLDAHVWYKVLRELGEKAARVQGIVFPSYGITKDAFDKWRQEAADKLTKDYVQRYLVTAVDAKLFTARLQAEPSIWVTEQVRLAGSRYRVELNQSR